MSTEAKTIEIDPAIMADVQLIADNLAAGKPIPEDVARRVRQCSERITEETRRRYGLVNIAVPAIRELRDDSSES
jgi:hypothetical protein